MYILIFFGISIEIGKANETQKKKTKNQKKKKLKGR